jgi:hypothetical protein
LSRWWARFVAVFLGLEHVDFSSSDFHFAGGTGTATLGVAMVWGCYVVNGGGVGKYSLTVIKSIHAGWP